MTFGTMVRPLASHPRMVNQTFLESLKILLIFLSDNNKNAKKSETVFMRRLYQINRLLWRVFMLATAASALGACTIIDDHGRRPDTLSEIKPSLGPVRPANVRASDVIEPAFRPAQRPRPLANLPKPLLAKMITPEKRLQCVPYARQLSNIQIRGDAWTWWGQADGKYRRSGQPEVGSVMVLKRKNKSGSLGHVAYVEEIIDNRVLIVSHANWLNKGRLHNHTPVRDVSKANDWSEVHFWNTPSGHFGGTTYRPYGFILPNQIFASR
ncbi:MAG: CHAP domain-containing protein [Geminicoccaceae bacterium]